jgi:hypothetical protein
VTSIRLPLPPRFATDCLMGLLFHLDRAYTLTIYGSEVEISGPRPKLALEEVLGKKAAQVLDDRAEKGVRVDLRLSGNDKKYRDEIWRALSLPPDATPLEMIKTLASDPLKDYGKVRLPSVLKPEYYEYNRVPGYAGSENVRLARDEYPINVVAMSLAGYLLSRVGAARLERNQWVSVVVTPVITASGLAIDPNYRFSIYVDPVGRLAKDLLQGKGWLDGLFPETALALLLACTMGGVQFKLYAVKEAGGQEPATIFSAMQMDLRPLYERMRELQLTDERNRQKIIWIAKSSLDVNAQGLEKTLATRFALLLYEVLSRARPPEEFVSVVNREYLSIKLFRDGARSGENKRAQKIQQLVESAVKVSKKIWSSLMQAEAI